MGSLESNVGRLLEQCQNFNSIKLIESMKNFVEQFVPEIIKFKSQDL